MTTRMRGFLIVLASLIAGAGAYWLVFRSGLSKEAANVLQYPLALPIVGLLVGGLEFVTGVPIQRLNEGWQRLPGYAQGAIGLVGGTVFLWGLVKVLGF